MKGFRGDNTLYSPPAEPRQSHPCHQLSLAHALVDSLKNAMILRKTTATQDELSNTNLAAVLVGNDVNHCRDGQVLLAGFVSKMNDSAQLPTECIPYKAQPKHIN